MKGDLPISISKPPECTEAYKATVQEIIDYLFSLPAAAEFDRLHGRVPAPTRDKASA